MEPTIVLTRRAGRGGAGGPAGVVVDVGLSVAAFDLAAAEGWRPIR